jgi:hypothetical protein
MINFFRNIRKKLANENKPLKYLRYAIGEIVLVVFGILIALQINNWNENRKLRNDEIILLIEVKSNLELTLNQLKIDSLKNSNHIHQYGKIKHFIKEDLSYSVELDTAFGGLKSWSSPYPIYTAYSTLKTKGLDIISNTSIRNKIVDLYEYKFTRISNDYDKAEWTLYESTVLPFYSKYIRIYRGDSLKLARPNNFEVLKRNDEFINLLELVINERKNGLGMYKTIMLAIMDLIESIEDELALRN